MRGVGFQGHEWRFHPAAVFVRQIVSGAGAAPQDSGGLYFSAWGMEDGEPNIGYDETIPSDATEGVAEAMFKGHCLKLWQDTIGVCQFAMDRVGGTLELATKSIETAVGWTAFTQEEALLVGERVSNLQRLVSIYRGYNPESDFDISERMLIVPEGPAKGKALPLGPHLRKWREEFYQAVNWDAGTGQPRPEALARMGLTEFKIGKG
jgi:aldehyde:ferredoxin oxidoreductase